MVLNMPHRKSNSDKNFLGGVIQVGYILLAACMSRSVALHRTPAGQAPPFDAPPDKHVFPSCPALFAYICIRENCHNLANCGSLCSVHRKKKPGRRRASDWDLGCYLCAEPGEHLCCEAPACTRTAHVACAGLSAVPAAEWRCADCRAPDVTTAAAWLLRLAEPRAQGSPH